MSHVSVSICMTDTLKCGDVVANVIQSVAYGKLDAGAAEVWWCGLAFFGSVGHFVWLLMGIWLLDARMMRYCSQLLCHFSEITTTLRCTNRLTPYFILQDYDSLLCRWMDIMKNKILLISLSGLCKKNTQKKVNEILRILSWNTSKSNWHDIDNVYSWRILY